MSKIRDRQSNVLGELASIITLLERYPTLTTTDNLLTTTSINTSVGMLLSILEMFGLGQDDLIKWLAKLLQGSDTSVSDGILNEIETAIKYILMANVKDLLSCSMDPFLPDCLMKYANASDGNGSKTDPYKTVVRDENYKELVFDLNQIDPFGMLSYNPIDDYGSCFYFDTKERIFEGEKQLTPNTLYKSCDFNAYLWYVINKGDITSPSGIQRSTWDNRVQSIKSLNEDKKLRDNFFKEATDVTTSGKEISILGENGNSIDKKQIIICQYTEHPSPVENNYTNPSSNKIRVWINANRYYQTREWKTKKKGNTILRHNGTIWAFNYDFIFSMKLFDTKTLITQIVNSLLGIGSSISVSMTYEGQILKAKLSEIIKRVIKSDDTSSTDCFFSFSNDDYNKMLEDAMKAYKGEFTAPNGENVIFDADDLLTSISGITYNSNVTTVEKTLENISGKIGEQTKFIPNFGFYPGFQFIYDFIEQTILQIVLQLLSPKLLILYGINSAVMGSGIDNVDAWQNFTVDNLLKSMYNLIVNIIKKVKDILVQRLYDFVMEQLAPIIQLLISKIALETIKYYKDLIMQLIENCSIDLERFGIRNLLVDNVNYADIIPTADNPTKTENC